MKKTILIIAALAIVFSGCKKFLDVKSKTDVVENDLFSTEAGFRDAMAGIYYTMTDNKLYGDKLTMGLVDVLARRYEIYSYNNGMYYSDAYGTSSYYKDEKIKTMTTDIWSKMYNAVANTNSLLKNIDARRDVFSGNNYNLIKGEALGVRAFMQFDLLRMFGPSYLAGADKPSIPYVTRFNAKEVVPLYTVKAVCDSVIKDLNDAVVLLRGDDLKSQSVDNPWLNNRKSHFNYLAVEATLARVYLYKGDKPNALLHAKNVINAKKLTLITQNYLQTYPTDFTFTPEQIFALNKVDLGSTTQVVDYFESPYAGKFLGIESGRLWGYEGALERIYQTYTIGATDIRYNSIWLTYNDNFIAFAKYRQGSPVEFTKKLVPLIRLPEMYYIAAECSTSNTEATDFLNVVRKSRAIESLSAGLSNDDLQTEIFKEYQKEFYGEGQLFYYYKRLNMPEMWDTNQFDKVSTIGMYVFPLPDDEILNGNR